MEEGIRAPGLREQYVPKSRGKTCTSEALEEGQRGLRAGEPEVGVCKKPGEVQGPDPQGGRVL